MTVLPLNSNSNEVAFLSMANQRLRCRLFQQQGHILVAILVATLCHTIEIRIDFKPKNP